MPKKYRVRAFRDIPAGTVFRVLKEQNRPTTAKGMFIKLGAGVSRAYKGEEEIILSLSDVVDVVSFPREKVN